MTGKDIHDAMAYVGSDLVYQAETQRFATPLWQRALPVAAMFAVIVGLLSVLPKPVPAPAPEAVLSDPPLQVTEPVPSEIPDLPELPEITVPAIHPLQERFPLLDEVTLTDYPAGDDIDWSTFRLNEADPEDPGTDIYTVHGDQVLAIDAENGILLIRIQGEDYLGVLAVVEDPTRLHLSESSQLGTSGETVGTIAARSNGILACNGSHFIDQDGAGNGGILAGYAMCSGTAYNEDAHYGRGYFRMEIDQTGQMTLTPSEDPVADGTLHAVECAPVLVQHGVITVDENSGYMGKHPRTVVGQAEDGSVLMLVIEGRMPDRSVGTDLVECAEILRKYDCVTALNLDGGTSSILWYDGEYVTKCSNPFLPEGRLLPTAFVVDRNN